MAASAAAAANALVNARSLARELGGSIRPTIMMINIWSRSEVRPIVGAGAGARCSSEPTQPTTSRADTIISVALFLWLHESA